MTGSIPSDTPRVLVVKLSALGDVIHILPVVHQLREQWGARVDWVTQAEFVSLVECFADVENVIAFSRRSFFRSFGSFRRALQANNYDMAIDFQGLFKSGLVTRLARCGKRVGPADCRERSRWFYTETAAARLESRHVVDQMMDVGVHLGLDISDVRFPIDVQAPDLESSGPRVGLIPCSRWPSKNWPEDRFVSVGEKLVSTTGSQIFIFGSSADEPVCRRIEQGIGNQVTNCCGQTGLSELGGFLQAMDLVISVDTGPLHLAAAVGTPVLALFGPTDPERIGPYGTHHRVVTEKDWSKPRVHAYKDAGNKAMLGIEVEEVVQAAESMLEQRNVS